jgi:hypothetical protein
MKKSKKLKNSWKKIVRGLSLGDRIWIKYKSFDSDNNELDGILNEIGSGYVVVDKYIIERKEIITINKI